MAEKNRLMFNHETGEEVMMTRLNALQATRSGDWFPYAKGEDKVSPQEAGLVPEDSIGDTQLDDMTVAQMKNLAEVRFNCKIKEALKDDVRAKLDELFEMERGE